MMKKRRVERIEQVFWLQYTFINALQWIHSNGCFKDAVHGGIIDEGSCFMKILHTFNSYMWEVHTYRDEVPS